MRAHAKKIDLRWSPLAATVWSFVLQEVVATQDSLVLEDGYSKPISTERVDDSCRLSSRPDVVSRTHCLRPPARLSVPSFDAGPSFRDEAFADEGGWGNNEHTSCDRRQVRSWTSTSESANLLRFDDKLGAALTDIEVKD